MLIGIWGTFSFIVAVFAAALLVGFKMPRRKYFILRAIISCVIIWLISFGYEELLAAQALEPVVRLAFRTLNSFLVFVLTSVSMKLCFECNIWAALFCGTAGYCMQHISRRVYDFLPLLVDPVPSIGVEIPVLTVITISVYSLVYFLGVRKNEYNGIMTDNKVQIIVALMVALMTIFLNSFAGMSAVQLGALDLRIYIFIFSMVSSALALFVEFGLLSKKNAEIERDTLKQLMYQEREQYIIEKTMIDVINVKCHDLKHQLSALEGRIDSGELEKIKTAVDIYDSVFKTGNNALDVVLTTKSMLCENKNIKLTCMANGNKLSFMSDADIYSMFGNILDNAIDAVDRFEDPDKRLICLTITAKNNFVFIHTENYFSEELVFVDGLPQTTKKDRAYHGFGMRSIRLLTQKYNGDCDVKTNGGVFILDIMLPAVILNKSA